MIGVTSWRCRRVLSNWGCRWMVRLGLRNEADRGDCLIRGLGHGQILAIVVLLSYNRIWRHIHTCVISGILRFLLHALVSFVPFLSPHGRSRLSV